jgi:hypothetical protein
VSDADPTAPLNANHIENRQKPALDIPVDELARHITQGSTLLYEPLHENRRRRLHGRNRHVDPISCESLIERAPLELFVQRKYPALARDFSERSRPSAPDQWMVGAGDHYTTVLVQKYLAKVASSPAGWN